ncbi:ZYRO0C04466p [Zygosaccharomyces rouxii]|uniref:ZYRO0C04466p n=1 Tax=Zygosaccharomyces rouxii (strain ATCC 2623 / CBS 732 / NBRC 1130 / NCYC 568 / NRRL Y-229) TaxID=559307 RepID=C5DT08_ZYGRC|nr:uncharacterized protein ZYRO0C04466g [Zygosaccharomyces rouxii]KAH9201892.1 hypothetical protein LQ764DRAFT_89643 [Zygosaccharomyces rouxii]CAR26919.1 ZYRO0C04466p [Zygosaccharomyces rouxii]
METKIASLTHWLNDNGQFQLSENICVNENEISGRGVTLSSGIIRQNQPIVSVPSACQLNFHTVLYHISKFNSRIRIPNVTEKAETDKIKENELDPRYRAYGILNQDFLLNLSSFQLLELYILGEWILLPLWSGNQIKSFWEPYFAVWPSQDELKSFPAVWKCSKRSDYKDLLDLLPTASKNNMLRISNLVENDWQKISPILNAWNDLFQSPLPLEDQFEKFLHIYCIINSRCLYTEVPLKKDDILSKFTMVPFVDFLNHTQDVDLHCFPKMESLNRSSHGLGPFSIYCGNHTYQTVGEEVLLNYGAHSNDFLINEYGFVIPNNKWNYIDITPEVINMVKDSTIQKFLENNGYWGDYTVSAEDASYRVIVALSLIVTGDFRRVEKLLMGYISEDFFLPKIKPMLYKILAQLKDRSMACIRTLEKNANPDFCRQNLVIIHQDYIEIIEKNLSKICT